MYPVPGKTIEIFIALFIPGFIGLQGHPFAVIINRLVPGCMITCFEFGFGHLHRLSRKAGVIQDKQYRE
jgi:hypothetical protein